MTFSPLYSCTKAEIKRLQEANKAARKERQLLLKQQEEIERMRNSTFRLRERLKYAGGEPPPVSSTTITCYLHSLYEETDGFKGFISIKKFICTLELAAILN